MLLFGAVQVAFSQIPDFHDIEWLSIVAAVMSFAYTFIGLGLGIAKVIGSFFIRFDVSVHHILLYLVFISSASIEPLNF